MKKRFENLLINIIKIILKKVGLFNLIKNFILKEIKNELYTKIKSIFRLIFFFLTNIITK